MGKGEWYDRWPVGTRRPDGGRARSPIPHSPFPILLLSLAACTAITVRPSYRAFPQAAVDTVTAKPPAIIAAAAEEMVRLGFTVRVVTPAEGYLETRWLDLRAGRSRSEVRDPDHTVKIRLYVDLVTRIQSQVVTETVQRRSLDPSAPERESEAVVATGTPGDSLTGLLRAAIKQRFP